ncbi:hypothetical protein L7F22_015498, partial [Adiantum nelumboides]|nr:hypothetical protein [Adiantum nelumboides]
MEESSERRRERLRAMREEASLADDGEGSSVAEPPGTPDLPLLQDSQQPSAAPSPRFEFYTDPLAAFSGSQRNKKSRSSVGSVTPPEPSPSPLRQPSFAPPHPPGTGFSTPNATFLAPNTKPSPNLTPPGSFSPAKHGSNHQPSARMLTTPGLFNTLHAYSPHHPVPSGNTYPNLTPPGSINAPISSNLGSSAGGLRFAPFTYSGTAPHANSPASSHYKGRGSPSAPDNRVQSHGSQRSWGSFKQSPGSSSRGTPGKSGARGFHRLQGSYSDSVTSESFAKRSMLEDPWKHLLPVPFDSSVASRLDSCSASSSRDWLPKSIGGMEKSPSLKVVSVLASGPSLAESLAASFADAVTGEE